MKKTMKVMLSGLIALTMLSGCAAMAEGDEEKDYCELYPESLVFESRWAADGMMADLLSEDGGFRATVTKTVGDREQIVWEYGMLYNAEDNTLVSSWEGSRTREMLDDEGDAVESTVESEACTAVFSINESGRLVWKDEQEDAGSGVEFVKIGRFEGRYLCDRVSLEFTWNGEGAYTVYIDWADSASVLHTWLMNGVYDPGTDAVEALGMESRVEYAENGEIISVQDVNEEGCSAVFRFNENGNLVWTGTEGVHTEDMEFEPADMLEENG